jgi:ribosomal protein L22
MSPEKPTDEQKTAGEQSPESEVQAKPAAEKAAKPKKAPAAKSADASESAAEKKPPAKKPATEAAVEDEPVAEKKPPAKKPAAKKPAAKKTPVAEKADDAKAEKAVTAKAEKADGAKSEKPVSTKAEKPAAGKDEEPAVTTRREPKSAAVTPRRKVVSAQARYVRTSARKARMVCGHLRGKSVGEARAILAFTPREVARDWSKLLESAVANAENNHELVEDDLLVREAYADEGPTIKRFRPRAQGRATPIRKRTSHLTITLTPKP